MMFGHDSFGAKRDSFGDAMHAIRERFASASQPRGIVGRARCANCGARDMLYVTTPAGDRLALDEVDGGPLALDHDGVAHQVNAGTHAPHSCSRAREAATRKPRKKKRA